MAVDKTIRVSPSLILGRKSTDARILESPQTAVDISLSIDAVGYGTPGDSGAVSPFVFVESVNVLIEGAGNADILFAEGESVTNTGGSAFVFESGDEVDTSQPPDSDTTSIAPTTSVSTTVQDP